MILTGVMTYFIVGCSGGFDEKTETPIAVERQIMTSKHVGRTYEVLEFDANHVHHTILIVKEGNTLAIEKID